MDIKKIKEGVKNCLTKNECDTCPYYDKKDLFARNCLKTLTEDILNALDTMPDTDPVMPGEEHLIQD